MSDGVWMNHPDLSLEQPRLMPATAAPFHAAAGWVVVDPPLPPPKPEPKDNAPAAKPAAKAKTPRRPSTEKEQD
jgi:hypothetical protein